MNDETRQTEIQPQVLKKSSINVDRFPVYIITSHMRKLHTVADRAMSMIAWILETERFCRNGWKRCNVVTFLDWLSISYCVGCTAAGVLKMMQTFCILYERHTCSMCMRSKAALSVQNITDTLEILSKNKYILYFIDCCFLYSLLQTFYCNV